MDDNSPLPNNEAPVEEVQTTPASSPLGDISNTQKKPMGRKLAIFLKFLIIGGGLFVVFIIGLGISFSACFTIKGPPPPECAPVSLVSLVLMPGASLFILIPLARKIK